MVKAKKKAATKTPKKAVAVAVKVQVYGTKAGVLVVGANAAQVRKAMRAPTGNDAEEKVKKALKLYDAVQGFFKKGGRFKKPYSRTPKQK